MRPAKTWIIKYSIYLSSSSLWAEWHPHLRLRLLTLPEARWRGILHPKKGREIELEEPSREAINVATHTEERLLVAAIRNQIWDVQNGGM